MSREACIILAVPICMAAILLLIDWRIIVAMVVFFIFVAALFIIVVFVGDVIFFLFGDKS